MKVGILNSGGDVQGINAVIASIVTSAKFLDLEMEFIGIVRGWEGVLRKDFIELNTDTVRGISNLGGSILHAINKGEFAGKVGKGLFNQIPQDLIDRAKKSIQEMGIDVLVVIGGDGTLAAALQLHEAGVNLIGVPKTIDNDLSHTEQTFGFSTAVSIATEAIDRIHTTAKSHERVIFVETMGRHVGWIALYSGLAGGAHGILLPEFELNYDSLVEFLKQRRDGDEGYSVIVVSEGVKLKRDLDEDTKGGEMQMVGVTEQLMQDIEKLAPGEFEMRNVVLGHTQRGGTPNAEDRIMAKTYGVAVVRSILKKEFGRMVCMQHDGCSTVPISFAISRLNKVNEDSLAYKTAKGLGVFLSD